MRCHTTRHFDHSQRHNQNDKADKQNPNPKIATKAAVVDFMLYL